MPKKLFVFSLLLAGGSDVKIYLHHSAPGSWIVAKLMFVVLVVAWVFVLLILKLEPGLYEAALLEPPGDVAGCKRDTLKMKLMTCPYPQLTNLSISLNLPSTPSVFARNKHLCLTPPSLILIHLVAYLGLL